MRPICLASLLLVGSAFSDARAFAGDPEPPDPTKAEVLLPAAEGWRASLLLDNDVGVWTVGTAQIFPRYGCPEVFGLDDKGRCIVLVPYSGKWTPLPTVQDGEWLGALQHLDLDPHIDGPEIYTGGKKGNLFQIVAHHEGDFSTKIIARFPGEEIHTLVGADLLPDRPGQELLVFSRLGEVWDITPPTKPGGEFGVETIAKLEGRVRHALLLPTKPGEAPWFAAAGRFGKVELLRRGATGLDTLNVTEEPMGFGRLAMRPGATPESVVLYASRDDGVILRLEGRPGRGDWRREVIYAGPQGPRGVAAGRFCDDPNVESVAVFGYSKKVQLLTRVADGPWNAETLYEASDKGHWLSTAEIDGRNSTDELIGSGYGKQIFSLSRPPGYGLGATPIDPEPTPSAAPPANATQPPKGPAHAPPAGAASGQGFTAAVTSATTRPIRVAVRALPPVQRDLHPLSYRGGFETKSAIYETLVRRDDTGRLAPALAESWRIEDGGKRVVLTLREGATWHDGAAVTAASVGVHMKRWAGLPEHAWLRSSDHIRALDAMNTRELRITLDRPCALIPDLCAINPTAVRAPGALSSEGEFRAPIGSGPFRAEVEGDDLIRLVERTSGEPILLQLVAGAAEAIDRLLLGEVDVVADGWFRLIPRERITALCNNPDLEVRSTPGSSVTYLSFRMEGPTADLSVRAAIRSAIDRERLIETAEHGAADPCWTWAAPTIDIWPRGDRRPPQRDQQKAPAPAIPAPLRLLAERTDRLAEALAGQLTRAGIETVLTRIDERDRSDLSGDASWDMRVESTWGVPYDPYISLVARFLPAGDAPTAARVQSTGVDPRLAELVAAAAGEPDPDRLTAHYRQVQQRMDEVVAIVPLLVPHRLCVVRRGIDGPNLDHDLYRLDFGSIRREDPVPVTSG